MKEKKGQLKFQFHNASAVADLHNKILTAPRLGNPGSAAEVCKNPEMIKRVICFKIQTVFHAAMLLIPISKLGKSD